MRLCKRTCACIGISISTSANTALLFELLQQITSLVLALLVYYLCTAATTNL